MPCLSGTYDIAVGVLLQVAIVPGGRLNELQSQVSDSLNAAAVQGLMDTGADVTCISPAVVEQAGLMPVGKIQSVGVTGTSPMNQYTVGILLRFGAQAIGLDNLTVVEFRGESPNFQVLIGRDIICRGVLTMDFNGRFSFSV